MCTRQYKNKNPERNVIRGSLFSVSYQVGEGREKVLAGTLADYLSARRRPLRGYWSDFRSSMLVPSGVLIR
jgi:hypothetical protein